MENLRDSIIDYMKDHGENEDLFLRDLERIVDKEGDLVFPVLLNVFTQLDFNKSEAKEIWDGIIKRRLEMNEAVGRQVNLLTAICDYLLTVKIACLSCLRPCVSTSNSFMKNRIKFTF